MYAFDLDGDGNDEIYYPDNPDAHDTPDAKARYQSSFYQVNRKLFAVGYNYSNLAGV